jgi:hypothetical protein
MMPERVSVRVRRLFDSAQPTTKCYNAIEKRPQGYGSRKIPRGELRNAKYYSLQFAQRSID